MNWERRTVMALLIVLSGGLTVRGQSSSLYLDEGISPPIVREVNGVLDSLSPYIAQTSIVAVRGPDPRKFAVHDLVTVIVREFIENESDSEMDTEKDVSLNGVISAFPNLNISDLVDLQLKPSKFSDGTPELRIGLDKNFEGEGSYDRRDTFTTRLTARIIDIKPNGTLVLEARKMMQSDDERVNVVLTGTCRKDDVSIDNTILSTQIYDLRLIKEHAGEIRNATKKGWITKFFDAIFNF